jgi:hypothetical protein
MARGRKTISFSVNEVDYEGIKDYAWAKGHGGQFPASTFAHYAVFQMMKKYPLSASEMRDIEEKHRIEHTSVKAVQPDTSTGKKNGGEGC